jgi:hypothetical protein
MSEEQEDTENTAQSDFLDILEHLEPTASVIDVRIPLMGALDCSVLSKCNFTGITALLFASGGITSIKGIPEGVTKVICGENKLTDIPAELPDSLVELDLHENMIGEVREGTLPQGLKDINLCDNRINSLADLPKDLEILRCENNRMKVLNLTGIIGLRILKCGSNPLLVIEGVPDTLEEFDSDTDIVVEIRGKERGEHEEIEQKANYNEALYTFFEMKREYENRVFLAKRDIFRESKTKKEARMKIKMLKPKCSYCERPVGSIFKTEGRKFIARCGDSEHPCPFQIELFGGEYNKIESMMESYQRTVEFTKQSIIEDKLNVLYQYLNEKDAVDFFKDNLDYYTKQSVHLESLTDEYIDLYFNPETEEKILVKRKKIADIQDKMGELIREVKATENLEIMKDISTIYERELVPEINNLSLIQWQTREINENPFTGQFELFQLPYRMAQLEYTFGEYPRVIHYRINR